MADPKIRYDIEAGIKGEADVEQLAQTVRRLGDSLEGDLKQQANEAADALENLGNKRDAVVAFQALTNESGALAIELADAEGKASALAGELPKLAEATRNLAQSEAEARGKVEASTAELKEQRAALATLNRQYKDAARDSDEYKLAAATLTIRISELTAEVNAKKAALRSSKAETDAAAAAERKLGAEFTAAGAAAAKTAEAVRTNAGALVNAKSTLDGFGVSTENLAASEKRLEAAIGQVRERVVQLAPAFAQAAQASSTAVQRQTADNRTLATSYQGIQQQLQTIQQIASIAVGGSFLTGMIKSAAETADEFKNLQARMKLVVGEGNNFETSFRAVTQIALDTHSPLEATGTLFSKIAKASKDAGSSAVQASLEAAGLTTTINQSIQLSGASAEASGAAITQLIQGLQSGVLRGDEFNSVMEQAPRLAQALADGLGVTTGALRKMAEEGQLTSKTVISALTTQADTVNAEFSKLPKTVGRSLQDLKTQWLLYVGATDNGYASSANLARIIDGLSKNLDTLVSTLFAAGKAWAAIKLAGLAADLYKYVTATTASTAALAGNTAALASNTTAQVANAAAGRASAASAAAQGAAVVANTERIMAAGSVLGRFGFLAGPAGIALAALAPEIVSVGVALGEGIAKWQGYGKALESAEAMAKANEAAAIANAQAIRKRTIEVEAAEQKQFGLTAASLKTVAAFDELIVKGESTTDALSKIGKDFDLSTVNGAKNAGVALDRLLVQGKITADQFQDAWSAALKGEDLQKFEVLAGAAFKGAAREAERMAAVLDATAREAIRRTGLDFDLLAGGMSKATVKVLHDNDTLIQAFDRLKAQGVNVGQALAVSLAKAVDTADGQKSLDALTKQIESVRTKLGDKVTDGLLDQAKQKSIELAAALAGTLPGIQSVAEAMKNLGVTSDASLKNTADQAKKSYDYLTASGQASARELTAAFTKYAEDAIAANRGVATDALRIEAAMRGVQITTDAAGKSMVSALTTTADSAANAANGLQQMGNAGAQAGAQVRTSLEQANDAQERLNASTQKGIELENKRRGVDASGFAADPKGNRIVAGGDLNTLTGIAAFLKNAGVQDEEKARAIAREFADPNGNVQYIGNKGQAKYGGETISVALMRAAERVTFGLNGGAGSTPGPAVTPTTIPQSAETRTVNLQLNLNGTSYGTVATNAAGATALQNLLNQLQTAKATSA